MILLILFLDLYEIKLCLTCLSDGECLVFNFSLLLGFLSQEYEQL